MSTVFIVTGIALTVASIGSGIGKLVKAPAVMHSMESVGVKPNQVPLLAVLEIAGAVGLIAGIWFAQLGLAASAGLALYFLGAVVSHLRQKHSAAIFAPAFVIMLIALAVLYFQLQR